MKIKPTDKVKVKVQFEKYDRYWGSDGIATKNYNGSWENVLNTISENHSYNYVVGEDDGDGNIATCENVLESVIGCNGDGCDFIIKMIVYKDGNLKRKWTVINEDFDEEDIDCD